MDGLDFPLGVYRSVSLLDAVWLWARGTRVAFHTLDDRLINAGVLLAICLVTNFAVARLRYLSWFFARTTDYFYSMIQLTLAVPALLTLSYLAATLNAPLVDSALLRADHAIGFDWDALDTWVTSHHWADVILYDSYRIFGNPLWRCSRSACTNPARPMASSSGRFSSARLSAF